MLQHHAMGISFYRQIRYLPLRYRLTKYFLYGFAAFAIFDRAAGRTEVFGIVAGGADTAYYVGNEDAKFLVGKKSVDSTGCGTLLTSTAGSTDVVDPDAETTQVFYGATQDASTGLVYAIGTTRADFESNELVKDKNVAVVVYNEDLSLSSIERRSFDVVANLDNVGIEGAFSNAGTLLVATHGSVPNTANIIHASRILELDKESLQLVATHDLSFPISIGLQGAKISSFVYESSTNSVVCVGNLLGIGLIWNYDLDTEAVTGFMEFNALGGSGEVNGIVSDESGVYFVTGSSTAVVNGNSDLTSSDPTDFHTYVSRIEVVVSETPEAVTGFQPVWTRQLSASGSQSGKDVTFDPETGSVAVVGIYDESFTFFDSQVGASFQVDAVADAEEAGDAFAWVVGRDTGETQQLGRAPDASTVKADTANAIFINSARTVEIAGVSDGGLEEPASCDSSDLLPSVTPSPSPSTIPSASAIPSPSAVVLQIPPLIEEELGTGEEEPEASAEASPEEVEPSPAPTATEDAAEEPSVEPVGSAEPEPEASAEEVPEPSTVPSTEDEAEEPSVEPLDTAKLEVEPEASAEEVDEVPEASTAPDAEDFAEEPSVEPLETAEPESELEASAEDGVDAPGPSTAPAPSTAPSIDGLAGEPSVEPSVEPTEPEVEPEASAEEVDELPEPSAAPETEDLVEEPSVEPVEPAEPEPEPEASPDDFVDPLEPDASTTAQPTKAPTVAVSTTSAEIEIDLTGEESAEPVEPEASAAEEEAGPETVTAPATTEAQFFSSTLPAVTDLIGEPSSEPVEPTDPEVELEASAEEVLPTVEPEISTAAPVTEAPPSTALVTVDLAGEESVEPLEPGEPGTEPEASAEEEKPAETLEPVEVEIEPEASAEDVIEPVEPDVVTTTPATAAPVFPFSTTAIVTDVPGEATPEPAEPVEPEVEPEASAEEVVEPVEPDTPTTTPSTEAPTTAASTTSTADIDPTGEESREPSEEHGEVEVEPEASAEEAIETGEPNASTTAPSTEAPTVADSATSVALPEIIFPSPSTRPELVITFPTVPVESSTVPVESSTVPVESSTVPVESSTVPVESSTVAVESSPEPSVPPVVVITFEPPTSVPATSTVGGLDEPDDEPAATEEPEEPATQPGCGMDCTVVGDGNLTPSALSECGMELICVALIDGTAPGKCRKFPLERLGDSSSCENECLVCEEGLTCSDILLPESGRTCQNVAGTLPPATSSASTATSDLDEPDGPEESTPPATDGPSEPDDLEPPATDEPVDPGDFTTPPVTLAPTAFAASTTAGRPDGPDVPEESSVPAETDEADEPDSSPPPTDEPVAPGPFTTVPPASTPSTGDLLPSASESPLPLNTDPPTTPAPTFVAASISPEPVPSFGTGTPQPIPSEQPIPSAQPLPSDTIGTATPDPQPSFDVGEETPEPSSPADSPLPQQSSSSTAPTASSVGTPIPTAMGTPIPTAIASTNPTASPSPPSSGSPSASPSPSVAASPDGDLGPRVCIVAKLKNDSLAPTRNFERVNIQLQLAGNLLASKCGFTRALMDTLLELSAENTDSMTELWYVTHLRDGPPVFVPDLQVVLVTPAPSPSAMPSASTQSTPLASFVGPTPLPFPSEYAPAAGSSPSPSPSPSLGPDRPDGAVSISLREIVKDDSFLAAPEAERASVEINPGSSTEPLGDVEIFSDDTTETEEGASVEVAPGNSTEIPDEVAGFRFPGSVLVNITAFHDPLSTELVFGSYVNYIQSQKIVAALNDRGFSAVQWAGLRRTPVEVDSRFARSQNLPLLGERAAKMESISGLIAAGCVGLSIAVILATVIAVEAV